MTQTAHPAVPYGRREHPSAPAPAETSAIASGASADTLLRAITDTAIDSIFCKDLDGRYTYINPAMANLFDTAPDNLIGKKPEDVFDPESARIVAEVDRANLRGESVNAIRAIEIGGRSHTFHTIQVPLRDGAGAICGICGIVRDVTQATQGEEEIRKRRAQLSAVVDSVPFDLFALDAGGRYCLQNEVCRRHYGDLIGKSPQDATEDPKVLALWLDNNRRATAGETVTAEVAFPIDGNLHHFYNVITPIWRDGIVDGIVGINVDITERKRYETELRGLQDRLESLVEERTQKLSEARDQLERQLEETRRMEREILHVVSRERMRMSHELHDSLGQQLAGVQYLSDALQRRLANEGHTGAEDADDVARLAGQAVQEVKAIAKGLSPVGLAESDLDNALQEMAETTTQIFGVRCTCKTQGSMDGWDTAMTSELYYIARESVINAVRHASPNQIAIALDANPRTLDMTIVDDGRGLPEPMDKTGLGMRIMHYRAQTIGADLDVAPGPHGGTRVHCRLSANDS